ncbi:ubiquitin fusion degradation protein 1-like [Heracleum sosnowskyi]|uniref:Ubiquitin fusion degradation protein 1-like n=1 Tax=Heracleum sosnowskyi TaxID=360622 RepID=A0AAD8HJE3_9APIA|nr:ubiquitin fusion degradation protein 1-like [Heracleum sosnowskyi]
MCFRVLLVLLGFYVLGSKPSFSYDVDDDQNSAGDKLKPSFSYDVDDDQNNAGDKPKPNFSYQCYPLSRINKSHCEDGNKIIMPASALEELMSMTDIVYPITVKIINPLLHKFSHCGVLEFSGEEGNVYLPNWMMNSLLLQQGQVVNIEYTGLSKGTFLKVQPHSTKFVMNLSDPKEAMEGILKDFACVTTGDTVMVNHENQKFTTPLDYKKPEKIKPKVEQVKEAKDATSLEKNAVFKPFTGVSRRLDEDDKKSFVALTRKQKQRKSKTKDNIEEAKFQPFTGKKYTLYSC